MARTIQMPASPFHCLASPSSEWQRLCSTTYCKSPPRRASIATRRFLRSWCSSERRLPWFQISVLQVRRLLAPERCFCRPRSLLACAAKKWGAAVVGSEKCDRGHVRVCRSCRGSTSSAVRCSLATHGPARLLARRTFTDGSRRIRKSCAIRNQRTASPRNGHAIRGQRRPGVG